MVLHLWRGAGSTCLTCQACCCLWAWHRCQGQGSWPAPRPLCRCVFTCGEVPAPGPLPSLFPPVTYPPFFPPHPSQSGTGTSLLSHLESKLIVGGEKNKREEEEGRGREEKPSPHTHRQALGDGQKVWLGGTRDHQGQIPWLLVPSGWLFQESSFDCSSQ